MTGVSPLHNVEEIRSERVLEERKRGTMFSSSSIRMVIGIQSVRITFASEKVMCLSLCLLNNLLYASRAELAYSLSLSLFLSLFHSLVMIASEMARSFTVPGIIRRNVSSTEPSKQNIRVRILIYKISFRKNVFEFIYL